MIDWNLAKKMTLWNCEELIKKISEVFSYSFIQESYNHNMEEAADYVKRLLAYDLKHEKHVSKIADIFKILSDLKVENYADLIQRVKTKRYVRILSERRNYV